MKKKYKNLTIDTKKTIKEALLKMDSLNRKALVLVEHGEYEGVLSIGDIQRALLKEFSLETSLYTISRPRSETTYRHLSDPLPTIKNLMIKERIDIMPIVDDAMRLHDIVVWDEVFEGTINTCKGTIEGPVVIMAGGYGTRLKPLTNIIPKALVPVFEKPILQEIIDRFYSQGTQHFYLTVNYKSDMIRNYFDEIIDRPYTVEYLQETEARGTAGSLNLLKGNIKETFIVTNCDIVLEQDYSEILAYHRTAKNTITAVGAIKNFDIPYGVLHTKNGGTLTHIEEKPDKSYLVNTGFYILEPEVLEDIPEEGLFHMTHLIEKVIQRKGKVGVFPVNDNSWLDMGDWYEFYKMRDRLLGSRK